eukprot:gnl/TRDRNA2_/TRDRNA2_167896_c1_seq18.p1 gnl/TRDRNA2_/TRDRNA2_167896_c1~~gnl/TRDRNA2_/TRDRNA2_167896_c1_seq18.p1  ORF type:complete len:187 (-),score=18.19 gnl/TRDRNA2_/TRDRNA2_167896_c1_seq18:235-720(-)
MDGTQHMVDDKPAIAHILQEGMKICHKVTPARRFLSRLGAEGNTYSEMIVSPLPGKARRLMREKYPANALREESDQIAKEYATSEDLCRTVKSIDALQSPRYSPSTQHRSVTHDPRMKPMPGAAYGGHLVIGKSLSPRLTVGGHPRAQSFGPSAFKRPVMV